MEISDNNKISHRQLRKQLVLVFVAPVFLCVSGSGKIYGIDGFFAIAAALLTIFLLFLLVRKIDFGVSRKKGFSFFKGLAGIFFFIYTILTASCLLVILSEILPSGVLIGIPAWQNILLAVLVCAAGMRHGIQRQGRLAEVAEGATVFFLLLMLVVSLQEIDLGQVRLLREEFYRFGSSFWEDYYTGICIFSGFLLLPFSMKLVEDRSSAGRPVAIALLQLFGITSAVLFVLPVVLGNARMRTEAYPILPLLKGANPSGEVLDRFDIFWIFFLLAALLYTIGTLFFYGNRILEQTGIGSCSGLMVILVYLLSLNRIPGWDLQYLYQIYLTEIFVPGMLVIYVFFLIYKKPAGKKALLFFLALGIGTFSGCAGVEPEKRIYPLAMSAEWENGIWRIRYSMADMQSDTGQEKPEEDGFESVLTLEGESLSKIAAEYEKSQDKYLDLGHLKVLILGESMVEERVMEEFFASLRKEPVAGEDVMVFVTDQVEDVMNFEKAKEASIGTYLEGIYKNRSAERKQEGVSLRKVYRQWYQEKKIPTLPEIRIEGGQLLLAEKKLALARENNHVLVGGWWGWLYPEYCFSDSAETGKTVEKHFSFWVAKGLKWW